MSVRTAVIGTVLLVAAAFAAVAGDPKISIDSPVWVFGIGILAAAVALHRQGRSRLRNLGIAAGLMILTYEAAPLLIIPFWVVGLAAGVFVIAAVIDELVTSVGWAGGIGAGLVAIGLMFVGYVAIAEFRANSRVAMFAEQRDAELPTFTAMVDTVEDTFNQLGFEQVSPVGPTEQTCNTPSGHVDGNRFGGDPGLQFYYESTWLAESASDLPLVQPVLVERLAPLDVEPARFMPAGEEPGFWHKDRARITGLYMVVSEPKSSGSPQHFVKVWGRCRPGISPPRTTPRGNGSYYWSTSATGW